jgi:hypothetical protein
VSASDRELDSVPASDLESETVLGSGSVPELESESALAWDSAWALVLALVSASE